MEEEQAVFAVAVDVAERSNAGRRWNRGENILSERPWRQERVKAGKNAKVCGEDDAGRTDCGEREQERPLAPEGEKFDAKCGNDPEEQRKDGELADAPLIEGRVSRQAVKTDCACDSEDDPHRCRGDSHPLRAARSVVGCVDEGVREQDRQRGKQGKNVFGKFGLGKAEKEEAQQAMKNPGEERQEPSRRMRAASERGPMRRADHGRSPSKRMGMKNQNGWRC